jgi:hypothetical protein
LVKLLGEGQLKDTGFQMRRLGKWLVLIGLVLPFLYTIFSSWQTIAPRDESPAIQSANMQKAISRSLEITMLGLPIGILGAGLWLFAVVRDANRYRQLKAR